jgi:hypothetical protein
MDADNFVDALDAYLEARENFMSLSAIDRETYEDRERCLTARKALIAAVHGPDNVTHGD